MKPSFPTPKHIALLALLGSGAGCSTPCIDMCQQMAMYLDECGYGWSTHFEAEGWTSIDDCYDDWWDADSDDYDYCLVQTSTYAEKTCY